MVETPEEFQDRLKDIVQIAQVLYLWQQNRWTGWSRKSNNRYCFTNNVRKLKKVNSPKINGKNYKIFDKKYSGEDLKNLHQTESIEL